MKRFGLKKWRLELPEPFVFQWYWWPQGVAVFLIAAHGDILGAICTACAAIGVFACCALDWTHYG